MSVFSENSTPSASGLDDLKLRAGERVRNYLLAEFASTSMENRTRLPSNKELARRLGVSSRTVHVVLQRFAEEGRIFAKRGSGTYLIADSKLARSPRRILISVPLGEYAGHDQWTDQIGGGIFRAAFQSQPPVILEGITQKHWGTDAAIEELVAKRAFCDGLILVPYMLAERHRFVLDAYAEAGKPVVHLHPPHVSATADFVSADFFDSCRHLAGVWVKSGRKRIASLSPFQAVEKRKTVSQIRQAGLTCGIGGALGKSVHFRLIENFPPDNRIMDESAGYQSMKQDLAEGHEPPDALYCIGDLAARGAMKALQEAGLNIPRDVSVVAGTGLNTHTGSGLPDLTSVRQPLLSIGEALLDLLLRRIEHDGLSLPAVIVPSAFSPKDSTTREENALLTAATGGTPP